MRGGLNYSRQNLVLMLAIYSLAALPFFTGGLVVTLAVSRLASRINAVYASDLLGAAVGCLVLIPLLDRVGAPGVVLTAAALALAAAVLFAPPASRRLFATAGAGILAVAIAGQLTGVAVFDVVVTKGHQAARSSSAVELVLANRRLRQDARHWSLSPPTRASCRTRATGHRLGRVDADPARRAGVHHVQYLRYELTAIAYH